MMCSYGQFVVIYVLKSLSRNRTLPMFKIQHSSMEMVSCQVSAQVGISLSTLVSVMATNNLNIHLNVVCKQFDFYYTNTILLEYRRLYSDLVLCFQLLSNGFNSQLVNALTKSADNRTRGHDLKLIKQTCSVDATKYYFTNRVVNVWNSLPSHIVNSPTLFTFKSRLQKHDLSVYLSQFTI